MVFKLSTILPLYKSLSAARQKQRQEQARRRAREQELEEEQQLARQAAPSRTISQTIADYIEAEMSYCSWGDGALLAEGIPLLIEYCALIEWILRRAAGEIPKGAGLRADHALQIGKFVFKPYTSNDQAPTDFHAASTATLCLAIRTPLPDGPDISRSLKHWEDLLQGHLRQGGKAPQFHETGCNFCKVASLILSNRFIEEIFAKWQRLGRRRPTPKALAGAPEALARARARARAQRQAPGKPVTAAALPRAATLPQQGQKPNASGRKGGPTRSATAPVPDRGS